MPWTNKTCRRSNGVVRLSSYACAFRYCARAYLENGPKWSIFICWYDTNRTWLNSFKPGFVSALLHHQPSRPWTKVFCFKQVHERCSNQNFVFIDIGQAYFDRVTFLSRLKGRDLICILSNQTKACSWWQS